MAAPLETDDAIVLILGAPTEALAVTDRIEGITRLEKLLFLLERETPIGELLDETAAFVSHHFGPFSTKVYKDVEVLSAAGLITDSKSVADAPVDTWESTEIIGLEGDDPYATRDFELTDRGKRYYTALVSELPESAERDLAKFKDRFGALPLNQLIRYVYQKYPDYTDKSKIRDQVLG